MEYAEIARRLFRWHETHQRSLPWRSRPAGGREPYGVWISEIMAQQTRLETVREYYLRWMERFPTLQSLAAADLQDVLKMWEGLGYYARARNLHRAARLMVSDHGGHFPRERQAALKLPGVGAYTAGAVLSLAYGLPEPILDGNVKRVLSRLDDVNAPITETGTLEHLWSLASGIVTAAPPGSAGTVNEGLMELGAVLCTPRSPRCLICPLVDLCRAAQAGVQDRRPVKPPRPSIPHYHVTAGVIWEDATFSSRLLIAQRPAEGMLGGLWEFPGGKMEDSDPDLPACLRREIQEELGIEIQVREPVTTVRHAYTHFRITLHAFHADHVSGRPRALGCADWRWIEARDLDNYPFPVTDQKIIAALRS